MPPNNSLSVWGNEKTMNLNTLVLTNIQSSPYFKVNLFELKTYHEVIDEIYYKVSHLEPWEKGSRKTAGQTGMCGGVRGVGAGGIVSSAFCLLYKLFTLKLTKKQVIGLITHKDSPYIRGLGFMYIRYTQPPTDLWAWFEEYLDDDEEIDVKAGGGHLMTVGEMLRQWLVKLEWYSTLFPRIPVPIEKDIAAKLKSRPVIYHDPDPEPEHIPSNEISFGEAERRGGFRDSHGDSSRGGDHRGSRGQSPVARRSPTNRRNQQASSPAYQRSSATRRSPPPRRTPPPPRRTPPPPRHTPPGVDHNSFERDLARERDRQRREVGPDRRRSRSRSPRDKRERRSHSRDRKEKLSHNHERKEKISGNKDREYHNSSSHKHSYKDREHQNSSTHKHSHKDKERYEREEKSHKHKSRDKLYR